ncbi:glutamyl-tRNA amidotransferase [Geothermobacter hydrogeniphilus]|uniref:Glutamyl-tRNA amidotransferase n=1 Tax=Geothermobacter hydrogeniphilus TaxID=1969733 RepID=A0A2K2HA98_9BACT|nr:GatB/YqeY domain-containing protein [Geothermobacter hydrogeniphilus]PNU20153.1 glutamyl-tRNA amidotransferase [Geothermobacter hydrogeniphilus]
MSLQDQLLDAMKTAMKARDSLRLATIRGVRTAIKNREIEIGRPLDDEAVISVIATLAKQRREAASAFRDGDRLELAEKEEAELLVLQEFLPAQLEEADLRAMVEETITALGATGMKDMGRVMKELTARTKGRADGKLVSDMVKARLAG